MSDSMPDKYDRLLGQLHGLPGMVTTRPVSIRVTPPLGVGGSVSYNVTTYRQAGEVIDDTVTPAKRTPATFTVFLEIVEGERAQRIVLPNEVVVLMQRQQAALTTISLRRSAKRAYETRKAAGHVPFVRRKK